MLRDALPSLLSPSVLRVSDTVIRLCCSLAGSVRIRPGLTTSACHCERHCCQALLTGMCNMQHSILLTVIQLVSFLFASSPVVLCASRACALLLVFACSPEPRFTLVPNCQSPKHRLLGWGCWVPFDSSWAYIVHSIIHYLYTDCSGHTLLDRSSAYISISSY